MYGEDYVVKVEVGIVSSTQVLSNDTYIIWIRLIFALSLNEADNPVFVTAVRINNHVAIYDIVNTPF